VEGDEPVPLARVVELRLVFVLLTGVFTA